MIDAPKVLVVGEIYVRRDDFAVDELVRVAQGATEKLVMAVL